MNSGFGIGCYHWMVAGSGSRVYCDEVNRTTDMSASSASIIKDAAILCDVVQNEWKVNAIDSGRENHYTLIVHSVGRKYIKITSKMNTDPVDRIGHAYMFIDKVTGKCYGVKSWNQADSLVRGTVTNFIDHPEMCSPYGGFAYLPKHR